MIKGFEILDFNYIQPKIEKLHKEGWDSGKFVGFNLFNERYSILEGSCTDFTGYPQSGKTELALEFLMNTARFYDWKHLLWVPDIGSAMDVMAKLIHKYTGQTFKRKYPNFIEIKTAFNACTVLLNNFKILYKTDAKAKMTPIQFWELAAELKIKEGLNMAMIDSWKDLNHDYNSHDGSYAKYLSSVLPERNDIAEQSKLHFFTVIHPKNPVLDKNRVKHPPDVWDMEGGAQWNNSGKCILAVHRENWDTNITDVYFRKIKPENIGRPSSTPVSFQFDISKSRYYCLSVTGMNRYAEAEQTEEPTNFVLKSFTEPITIKEPDEIPF